MAYQSYSAYHPNQSHSEALRPTLDISFNNHGAAYEPLGTHEAISPDTSPRQHLNPPFAQEHAYSSDSVNSGPWALQGGRDAGQAMSRQYSDDIPLRPQPTNQTYDPNHPQGTKGAAPFPGEAAMGAEELAREERRRHRSRREKKKVGILHKVAWVCWFMTLVQLAVFIGELVRASIATGSPIQTKPTFNPMIGPSSYILINMGARFVPCMKDPGTLDLNIQKETKWFCPNSTSSEQTDPNNQCLLGDLCGLNAGHDDYPIFQWFRFITPIFLHAGIIHIGFNLLLQMTLGREIEKLIGSVRFLIVYMASGIFGFVLGGNFAAPAIPSVGCSGSLFGITAISLLDLLYTWSKRRRPGVELALIFVEIVVSFALGLLPGLDNFSHIGGFLTGLVLGMCILRSPDKLRKRIRPKSLVAYNPTGSPAGSPTHTTAPDTKAQLASVKEFTKKPVGFFQGRKPLWWAWWLVRAGCLVGVVVAFIVLLTDFYAYSNTCSWCRYLSCLPVNGWCDIGRVAAGNTTTSNTNAKRVLLETVLT